MQIALVEIVNFRKLKAVRIDFAPEQTIFVGANNSGKTSAMAALRYFLVDKGKFSINDFTLSNWEKINAWGDAWEKAHASQQSFPLVPWAEVGPALDIWLDASDNEFHRVQPILPSLDWSGGRLGIRLAYEPKDINALQQEYVKVRRTNEAVLTQVLSQKASARPVAQQSKEAGAVSASAKLSEQETESQGVSLWPSSLTDFLAKRLGALFTINTYILDPEKAQSPEVGIAKPQALPSNAEPVGGDPIKDLLRVNEISAQRGFGQAEDAREGDEPDYRDRGGNRRLSEQLKRYYSAHLDPFEAPSVKDLEALKAIEDAQKAFDGRLKEGFSDSIVEMEKLGYPGVTDPHIQITTRLRPIDGLNHDSAVQYVVTKTEVAAGKALTLPEHYNGLGYQNLISMIFRLMSFRDAWLKVKKASQKAATIDPIEGAKIAPLHLVLVEEPEAHLHVQVQQVFIRQAYRILRNNSALMDNKALNTQLIVSTHSSHVAHECEFNSLRYFRRLPPSTDGVPTACVVNLTEVFGEEDDTKRFVTRYLRITHADLMFADAAILIEGPAERILVPHFVRKEAKLKRLNEAYVTWLEIGGSHAHRLRPLVEHLGLLTLVITDLDAIDEKGKSVPPKRGAKQKSRNATLRSWCPEEADLDKLIDLDAQKKCKIYTAENFAIRVAFQQALKVTFKQQAEVEAIPYTFEDALAYENLSVLPTLDGKGLVAKFKAAIAGASDMADLASKLHTALNDGGKAAFAMDVLEISSPSTLKLPRYIDEGLTWLAEQVKVRQEALLGVEPAGKIAGV